MEIVLRSDVLAKHAAEYDYAASKDAPAVDTQRSMPDQYNMHARQGL